MLHYTCRAFHELTLDELYDMMALRQVIFAVEQDCAYLDADGKDQTAWHVLGKTADGSLLAYARLLPKGVVYEDYASIGRVLNAKSIRGQGEGQHLMTVSLQQTKQLWPGVKVKISAQLYLLKFYESFGFVPQGETYLEDGIPHIAMLR